jgi:signal transduction histidine kinase
MKFFLDLPVRTKLLWIMLLSSGIALTLSMIAYVIYDSREYTDQRIRELITQAAVFGNINTAALIFNDPKSSTEYLATLSLRPQITAAAIYNANGKLFSIYTKSGIRYSFPSPQPSGYRVYDDEIDVYHRIEQNGEPIGTIYLHANIELLTRVLHILSILLVLMPISLGLNLWFSNKLQSIISMPILEISSVANAIMKQKNYGLRTKQYHADEIGILSDAFNQMLAQIQERDTSLNISNIKLQKEINGRKQAQDALNKYVQELARSNAELEQFAYVSSHDLQEPLRMVASYTQLLEKRYANHFDEKGKLFMHYIIDGAKRMQELIDDLLMFSRIGTYAKELQSISLEKPLEIALRNLDATIKESKAQIHYHRPLPAVLGDTTQLIQLFQNLISNAIKFRKKNESIRIEISARKLNDFWQVTVKDNGIGIEQEHFDRIFVIFQRLHARTEYPGSGIGLAICKKIVERHGGTIWLESELGIGTTFHFTLKEST